MPEAADNTSKFTCTNCREAPIFSGFDTCLACSVAVALVEDPQYIDFARRVFASDRAWLAQFEAEWNRQASALIAAGMQRAVAA